MVSAVGRITKLYLNEFYRWVKANDLALTGNLASLERALIISLAFAEEAKETSVFLRILPRPACRRQGTARKIPYNNFKLGYGRAIFNLKLF